MYIFKRNFLGGSKVHSNVCNKTKKDISGKKNTLKVDPRKMLIEC